VLAVLRQGAQDAVRLPHPGAEDQRVARPQPGDQLLVGDEPGAVSLVEVAHEPGAVSLSRSANVFPAWASRVSKGAGDQTSPRCCSSGRTRSRPWPSPTVSAYHIGPPRWAGNP